MSRAPKRRSEAISRNEETSSSEEERPPRRSNQAQSQGDPRRRRLSTTPANNSASEAEQSNVSENEGADAASVTHGMIKKLVRLALSCEYARLPIRRADINAKILKGGEGSTAKPQAGVNFRTIFNGAQTTLRSVFGMEMVDLPSRERTGLNDRRKAASQKATQKETQKKSQAQRELDGEDTQARSRGKDANAGIQNWILVSTLPLQYRTRPELLVPGRAPDSETEAAYVALCTVVVSLLYLHMPSATTSTDTQATVEDQVEPISDARLQRYLSRLGLSNFTPMGGDGGSTLEKTLARMIREGYVEKKRDTSGGEEVLEWVVGPRGKKEIGRDGVAALVRAVYGFGLNGTGKGLLVPQANGDASSDDEGADPDGPQRRHPVKMEKAELERRLTRTLGNGVTLDTNDGGVNEADDDGALPNGNQESNSSRRQARTIDEPQSTRRSARS